VRREIEFLKKSGKAFSRKAAKAAKKT
jgi:hypothetical protein